MLKIVAMLLVIAAVVSAAGCAGKEKTAGEKQETPNQTSPEVAPTTPEETPTETTEIAATTPAETPELTNNTTKNITENVTVQNGTHMSNTQRKLAMIKNQTKSSGTVNVSQKDSE